MTDQEVSARFILSVQHMDDDALTAERLLRPAWLSVITCLKSNGMLDDAAEVYVEITARTRKRVDL